MSHVLLILVLFGDPSGEQTAKTVGDELTRLGGASVQVVIGAEALKQLESRGVKESDLLASPVIANHLTKGDADLVVIRLERRTSGGDEVIESRVWSAGQVDNHVAIVGKGGDPTAGALNGILQVVGPRLPSQPGAPVPAEEGQLTALAEHADWKGLLAILATKQDKDPRQYYYQVLAQVRLGQDDQATKTLVAMRAAFPAHFLVKAAESLVPTAPATGAPPVKPAPASVDDGNVLRDAPPAKDDGGNTLR